MWVPALPGCLRSQAVLMHAVTARWVQVGDVELSLGSVVLLQVEEEEEEEQEGEEAAEVPLGLVQAMWQNADGEACTALLCGRPAAGGYWDQNSCMSPERGGTQGQSCGTCCRAATAPSSLRVCVCCRREAGAGAAAGARRGDCSGGCGLGGRGVPHYQAGDQVGTRHWLWMPTEAC